MQKPELLRFYEINQQSVVTSMQINFQTRCLYCSSVLTLLFVASTSVRLSQFWVRFKKKKKKQKSDQDVKSTDFIFWIFFFLLDEKVEKTKQVTKRRSQEFGALHSRPGLTQTGLPPHPNKHFSIFFPPQPRTQHP